MNLIPEDKIEILPVESLTPYENNPRNNDQSVDAVAESIRQFKFRVPIIIDKNNVIVAGHTRLKAAKKLGMEKVPCLRAEDLTEEQIRAFRLADNKAGEASTWNMDKLREELEGISIDMSTFGFSEGQQADWFEQRQRYDNEDEDEDEEYKEFTDKFKQKKTTDDCYTPDRVYNAIADWVAKEYKLDRKNFVRPFYPGGDYQKQAYKPEDIVVDNPPFSIEQEICDFYNGSGVKFFLFAPGLTCFRKKGVACAICTGAGIEYENGAIVQTNFLTNLEETTARSSPDLYQVIKAAVDEERREKHKEVRKLSHPREVVTAAGLNKLAKYGQEFRIMPEECTEKIGKLDNMTGTDGIFGGAYLIAEKAAAEKAAAEKAAAEKAAAEKAAAEHYDLSEREKELVAALG